jgi:hypothetical protein
VNCATFQGMVHELADGIAAPADAAAAREHAAGCKACADCLESARRFSRFLANEGDAAIDAWSAHVASMQAAADAALAPAVQVAAAPRGGRIHRLGAFAAVAAASALIVAVGFSLFSGREVLAEEQPTTLTRGQHVFAADGRELEAEEAANVVVPRGTAGAVVRLTMGTVLFRVEPGRAFSVETPQGTASALGTSFHVGVTAAHQVSVAVHSGSVRFAGAGDRDSVLLGAGDRLEVDANGAQRLINRRRLDDLQTDLTAFRETAARQRRELEAVSAPPAETPPAAAPAAPASTPTADAVRAFLESDEGKALLAAAIRSVQDEQMAQGAARMMDGMVARFAKDVSLADDQARHLREILRRSGAEFREAWAPLNSIPSDASEAERDRVRHEVAAKSAEIEQRKDDEVRNLLSQTQYEAYKKQFAMPKKGFGGGAKSDSKDGGN